jgi:hypothetical protein
MDRRSIIARIVPEGQRERRFGCGDRGSAVLDTSSLVKLHVAESGSIERRPLFGLYMFGERRSCVVQGELKGAGMVHWFLTKILGFDRRVYFTGTPDRAWANYHDKRGKLRHTRNLR